MWSTSGKINICTYNGIADSNCWYGCYPCNLPLKDIFKQATEDRLTSAKELPYFEGDFWPNVLEESIKELEQEEEERKREENSTSNESIDVRMLWSVSMFLKNMYIFCCVAKERKSCIMKKGFSSVCLCMCVLTNKFKFTHIAPFLHRTQKVTVKMPRRRTTRRQVRTRAAWAEPTRRSQGCLMSPMTFHRNSTPLWKNTKRY